jgi:cyclophilin family peptidyl-prolyl cis-trans isomerase
MSNNKHSRKYFRTAQAVILFSCCILSPGISSHAGEAVVDTTPADIAKIPLFDYKKDGPLITKTKTLELQTNAGPITLSLNPSMAPLAATYMYKLFSSGTFTGTPIHRYDPNFVIQINNAWEKAVGQSPLSNELRLKLRRLPLEVSTQKANQLSHHKYVLSLAHYDGGPDSAVGSFSILVGDAPHLDHQYTIFGEIVEEPATLETLAKIENNFAPNKYWVTGTNIR